MRIAKGDAARKSARRVPVHLLRSTSTFIFVSFRGPPGPIATCAISDGGSVTVAPFLSGLTKR